jgi:SAM-dependent methyltransferase
MKPADGIKYYAYVAELYDTYVDITFDIPFFLNETKGVSGKVLELMAGTGRVSIPLIKAGVRLTCVDNSSDMLAVLQEKLERQNLSASVYHMDVRYLDLDKQFALAIVPFNSFSELLTESDQRQALTGIYEHLAEGGRFICTLHNPPVRLRRVDGQLVLRRKHELDNNKGTLLLWGLEKFDQAARIVRGLQFFEEYDASGVMQRRTLLEIQFCLPKRDEFKALARSAGFRIAALYGDYAYSEFQKDASPFMVWVLEKPPAAG